MSGSPGMATNFRCRRPHLIANFCSFENRRIRVTEGIAALLLATLLVVPAIEPPVRAQASSTAQGAVKITLDDAIQLGLQHNHNLLAAQTTIQQDQALEIAANLRPNPTIFGDWEYLPLTAS